MVAAASGPLLAPDCSIARRPDSSSRLLYEAVRSSNNTWARRSLACTSRDVARRPVNVGLARPATHSDCELQPVAPQLTCPAGLAASVAPCDSSRLRNQGAKRAACWGCRCRRASSSSSRNAAWAALSRATLLATTAGSCTAMSKAGGSSSLLLTMVIRVARRRPSRARDIIAGAPSRQLDRAASSRTASAWLSATAMVPCASIETGTEVSWRQRGFRRRTETTPVAERWGGGEQLPDKWVTVMLSLAPSTG